MLFAANKRRIKNAETGGFEKMAVLRKKQEDGHVCGHGHGCFGWHCLKLGIALASLYLLCALFAYAFPETYVYLAGVMTHGMLYVNTATASAADYAAAAARIDLSLPTILVGTLAWLVVGYLASCLLCYSHKMTCCNKE